MQGPTYQPGTVVGKLDAPAGTNDQYGIDLTSASPANNNQFGFYIRDSVGYKLFHGGAIDATPIAHVVMTWNGTTMRGYVNGVEIGNIASGSPIAGRNAASFNVGGEIDAKFFQGTIDEVAYYNTAVSAARVLAHFQAGLLSLNEARDDFEQVRIGPF
jgi:hypothetical protein